MSPLYSKAMERLEDLQAEAEPYLIARRVFWLMCYVQQVDEPNRTSFASASGLHRAQFSNWMIGHQPVSYSGALILCARYDITPEFMFFGRHNKLNVDQARAWLEWNKDPKNAEKPFAKGKAKYLVKS